ncbi:MAG: site-specific integrase, partial [Rhizobiaceae bacterium]|nr:site-specific integrase [Rhizobiaceae bacterium]
MHDEAPTEMPLATVLTRYWHGHVVKLDSHGKIIRIPSHDQAKHALALWTEFWGEAVISDLTITRQEEFMEWLKDRGYRNSYVSRVLSVGRAALNWCRKRGEISEAPFIIDEPDRSDKKLPYRLSTEEMRKLLRASRKWQHLHIYCMIALNTLARPEAVLDLSPAQVDLEIGRINLNPHGRRQTKKRRPVVPLTETLRPHVSDREVAHFVNWHGRHIKSIKKGFATMVAEAGLPKDITPYSLRHTMAKMLRAKGVQPWEVQGMLGHRMPGPTEDYAEFDPDYCIASRKAIDSYFAELGPEFVSKPVSEAICVPLAWHSTFSTEWEVPENSAFLGAWMVGVTGI